MICVARLAISSCCCECEQRNKDKFNWMLKGSLFSAFAQLFQILIYFAVYAVSHANTTWLSVTVIILYKFDNGVCAGIWVCVVHVLYSTGKSAGTVIPL